MRVLCITDITMPGGVDTYIQQLITTATVDDSSIDLYLLMDNQEGSDNLYRLTNNILKHKCIRKSISSNHNPGVIVANLQEILEKIKPDVVHIVCGWPCSALIIREYIAGKNIPFFFTESLIDEKWCFPNELVERIICLYHKATKIFTVSKSNTETIKNIYHWPTENIISIPNGVDTAIIKPKKFWKEEIGRFVTVTRLDYQKGIDVLIKAIHKLPQTYKNKLSFTIWGDGKNRQEYQQLIDEYDLSQIVHMPGWNYQIKHELCNYDCFILPSRFEGMPIALIEAMAAKLFCIGSEVSGIPEIFNNGEYGMMFKSECADELCDLICYCVDNVDLCRDIALKGYEHILKNHDCYLNMKQIITYWKSAV